MTAKLTPEERLRITEEQQIRNQETLRSGMKLWLKMLLIMGGIILALMVCSLLFYAGFLGSIFASM